MFLLIEPLLGLGAADSVDEQLARKLCGLDGLEDPRLERRRPGDVHLLAGSAAVGWASQRGQVLGALEHPRALEDRR